MPTSVELRRTTASVRHQKESPKEITAPLSLPPDAVPYHTHPVGPNQCSSALVQPIAAPLPAVWSLVRRFDDPLPYKHFLRSCHVVQGSGLHVGSIREVHVVSGIPAESSTERLEILDDDRHVISFRILGGEHRLSNYKSVMSLHGVANGEGTLVIESFVVDVPEENTDDETCTFVETIVRCNLKALARITENSANRK